MDGATISQMQLGSGQLSEGAQLDSDELLLHVSVGLTGSRSTNACTHCVKTGLCAEKSLCQSDAKEIDYCSF